MFVKSVNMTQLHKNPTKIVFVDLIGSVQEEKSHLSLIVVIATQSSERVCLTQLVFVSLGS